MAIKINHLDHVSIRVNDVKAAIEWYQQHLGLEHRFKDVWGFHPAMMMTGNTGVAIFPTKCTDAPLPQLATHRFVDHFAFNVDKENFQNAQQYFKAIDLPFHYQDHIVTASIYIKDLDGHTVELTTFK